MRSLFRMFFLFSVLVAVALLSAITTIRLSIHSGVEVLPNFVGLSVDQATHSADPMGLEVTVEDRLFNPDVPAGKIISQLPVAGTHIKPGQHVHVLVSLGAPQFTVPSVVGSTLRAARIMAIQRGLSIGDLAAVHWAGGVGDEVVGQDPSPSATELHSPAINFLVSLGDAPSAYVCPNFAGRSLSDVRALLDKAGFQLIQNNSVPTPGAPKDTVISQTPPPGSRITSETVFNFQVAE